ncbi:DUF2752 domain-containing protein [Streptomyces daqingensis]|uniref:DUF2752 domain-containing protein n=1 Tax=Streptomyces daqingensis TaxID=1472640 RepID=UPI001663C6AA|nr:DUF2752 domain-containing protein [Streptomyces daqingensis]
MNGREPAPAGRRPASPASRLVAPGAAVAVAGAAFAYVGSVDPNEPGHYPVCPLLALTGVYCPGCGGLRSAHALAHGDVAAALGANALAVLGFALFAVFVVFWVVRVLRSRPVTVPLRSPHWWALGIAALIFTVVRNMPVGTSLAP